jgi:hypothetical protein
MPTGDDRLISRDDAPGVNRSGSTDRASCFGMLSQAGTAMMRITRRARASSGRKAASSMIATHTAWVGRQAQRQSRRWIAK